MLNMFSQSLSKTASDLWSFIKRPEDKPDTAPGASGKLRVLLQVLLIDIVICMLLTGVLEGLERLGWYSTDSHAVAEMLYALPVWGMLLLGVVFIPLLEELIFRFGLRFRRGFFGVLFTIVLLVLAGFGFKLLPLLWALGVMLALGVVLVLYFINAYAIGNYLEQVWPRKYRYVFYTVAFLFGLIHITNFTDFNYASAALLLIPIIVAPQIWAGLALGYMRVKYGFFWGFYLHAAHNAFFFTLGLLFLSNVKEKLNISNENYTLKIEEHMRREETATSHSHIGHDTIAFENTKLDKVIADLLQKDRVSVQYEKSAHLGKSINLAYKGKTADMEQSRKHILAELQELYDFDVTTIDVEQEMWDIRLGDSSTLAHHIAEDSGPSKVTVTPIDITLENATVGELLKAVKEEFYLNVTDNTAQAGRYNFKLAKNGFEQLREELQSKYGITMQPRKIMAEQAVVSFRPKP